MAGDPQSPEAEGGVHHHNLGRVEVFNLLLATLVSGGFWFASGPEGALGVAVGALVTASSLRVVRVVMGRILRPGPTSWWPVAVFWLKYMAVIALIGLIVLKFKLDVAGFLTGVTLLLPAIVLEAAARAASREE